MAVQSHIESLEMRHRELETQLSELMSKSSRDENDVISIKRQKLKIKDRIEELRQKATV